MIKTIYIILVLLVSILSLLSVSYTTLLGAVIGTGLMLISYSIYYGLLQVKNQFKEIHLASVEDDYFKLKSDLKRPQQ